MTQQSERHPNDYYPSPPWFGRVLAENTPQFLWDSANLNGYTLWEPAAGEETLLSGLVPYCFGGVRSNDINGLCDTSFDLVSTPTEQLSNEGLPWPLVVSNLPYNLQDEIVPKLWQVTGDMMALLCRQTWMAPTEKRSQWLQENPCHLVLVLPRYKFRRGKNGNWQTDSCNHAWFVWYKDPQRVLSYPGSLRFFGQRVIPKSQIPGFCGDPESCGMLDLSVSEGN